MMASTPSSISPANLHIINKPKHISCYQITPIKCPTNSSFQPLISRLTLSKQYTHFTSQKAPRKPTILRVSSEDAVAETSEQIVSATSNGDDGVSTIISGLLLIAFIALTILTIGVVYIAVTDFLTKREKEKFEKEEAAKMKKKGGKKKVGARARDGPRGFGQPKIEEDFDY